MRMPTPRRILLARQPVDLRRSIDGLAALVERLLPEPPLAGAMIAFFNLRRNAIRLLVRGSGGFILVYKRLEHGQFRVPDADALSVAALAAVLEGIDLPKARRLSCRNP